jgi:hypothetical protein
MQSSSSGLTGVERGGQPATAYGGLAGVPNRYPAPLLSLSSYSDSPAASDEKWLSRRVLGD